VSQSKVAELLDRAYENNAQKLVEWASQRCKTREDAEDLCQEVMVRLYRAIISKEAEGEAIQVLDDYLWKIAFSLLRIYNLDVEKNTKLIREVAQDIELQAENIDIDSHATDSMLQRLRKSISMLDYNHREAMIMFNLERRSLSEIGEKLGVSESYVKKLLFESRKTIKANSKNGLYDIEKLYRPDNLGMSFSGEEQSSSDLAYISECLCRQNICLGCYKQPTSMEELATSLGLPLSYIEFYIKWLVNKGFLKKQRNKYSTNFFIFDGSFRTMLTNVYIKHKSRCLDKIIESLMARHDQIKAVNFIGADRPINELLWFLIYRWTDMASALTCFGKYTLDTQALLRTEKGQYLPIGIFNTTSHTPLNPVFEAKYKGMEEWECNGTNIFDDGENKLTWLGLSNARETFYRRLSPNSLIPDVLNHKELLFKVLNPAFKISELSTDERYLLSAIIDMGYLSMVNNKIIPNYYVFTKEKQQKLERIFLDIYNELKLDFSRLSADLHKMCKNILPKQLNDSLDYIAYFSLLFSHFYTTGFAFYDGKLYQPQEENEYTLLTLCMTCAEREINLKQKSIVNMNISFTK